MQQSLKVAKAVMVSVVMLAFSAMFCVAAEHNPKQPTAGNGKKKLLLFAKNPASWAIVTGGGNGMLVYREATRAFTLNAAGLQAWC